MYKSNKQSEMMLKQTTWDTDIPDQLFKSNSEISAKCLWLIKIDLLTAGDIYAHTLSVTFYTQLKGFNTTYIHFTDTLMALKALPTVVWEVLAHSFAAFIYK